MEQKHIKITVDEKDYFFLVEAYRNQPVPPQTVIIISERTKLTDDFFDAFTHRYVCVDEGYTSSQYMLHPLNISEHHCILTADIRDKEERAKVVNYIRSKFKEESTDEQGNA